MTKRQGVAFIDGNYVKTEDAKISVFDLGFERSDVAYDVISTWKGLFFRLDDHLDRFLRSAQGFRISSPYLYWSKREAGWLGPPIEDLLKPEPTESNREGITH